MAQLLAEVLLETRVATVAMEDSCGATWQLAPNKSAASQAVPGLQLTKDARVRFTRVIQ